MTMKTVVVLAVSLWTILSPVHAALPTADCSSDATICTASGTGADANAECSGSTCVCKPAYVYKEDTSNCVTKGLGDKCAATTDCVAVTHAVCPTPIDASSVCTCDTLYKKDGAVCVKLLGSACSVNASCSTINHAICDTTCKCSSGYKQNAGTTDCVKVLGSACAADTDCSALNHGTCDSKQCACSTGYKANTGTTDCDQIYDMACTKPDDCTGAQYECTASKCTCANTFDVKDNVCVMKLTETTCSNDTTCPTYAECKESKCACKAGFNEAVDTCEVQNGASGMSPIGLLCVILMLFSYLTKY